MRANSDGSGFCYIKDNKVIVNKGFFDFEELWESFNKIQETNSLPKIFHARIATSGLRNEENMHPFSIDERHAFAHNGILCSPQGIHSDTFLFNETMLKPIFKHSETVYKEYVIKKLLEQDVGSYNKIAILGSDGDFVILNEEKGDWNDEKTIWRSNSSCLNTLHNKSCFSSKREYKPKNKSTRYVYMLNNRVLEPGEINKITKRFKKKMKVLAQNGVVERVLVYKDTNKRVIETETEEERLDRHWSELSELNYAG